ncbi:MAG: MFS transporter [Dorea sp.]
MKLLTKSNESNTSLGVLERLAYGSGNFGNGLFAGVISAFLLYFYTNYIHLNAGVVGVIFMIVRVTDGFTDLIMGHIVDRTRSKHGKARVWMLRMCIPYAIAGILLFTVPTGIPQMAQYVYVFVTYTLVSAVITTALAVPYSSMAALLTDNPYERGILGVFSMFGGTFAGMVVSASALAIVNLFGDGQKGWIGGAIVFAVVGVVFQLLCFIGTKERVVTVVESGNTENSSKKEKKNGNNNVKVSVKALLKNKYWVMFILISFGLWMIVGLQSTAMIYYCDSVLGNKDAYGILANVGNVSMLVFLMISFIFMKKLGKENTFRIGMVCALIGAAAMMFFPTNMTILIAGTFVRQAGAGLAAACMTGILADTLDYGEWKTGICTIGLGMAAYSACQKLGSGISAALWGFLLNLGKYDGAATVQQSGAIAMIKTGFYYIPLAVALLSLVLLMQFNLDKQHEKIHADLEERRRKVGL